MPPPRKPETQPTDEAPSKKTMNKVRTVHGTRVARRIKCSACGKSDTIDFAPKDPTKVLCRKCAFETYGVLDPDDVALRTQSVKCSVCRKNFDLTTDPERGPDAGMPVCRDCRNGVETKQGNKSQAATRVSANVVRVQRKTKT